ncbi:hypothetical protein BDV24DRAFT_158518 [Aspergillus arachidicola]|uniref:Uncharacterized protein n=1 Tax=Aspergillus arachidicola TaxID=656916 RepID=A0A5N6YN02_9EURO|nr:hypothetical protein BDV24DRAFT_158518 [Aspergillus arachidicola]
MRFNICVLTAFFAASAPVYAQGISRADVIQTLDSLTEEAKNLSSVVTNTDDPSNIGLDILTATNDLVAAIPDNVSLEGLGHLLFDDVSKDQQLVICDTYLEFHKVNMALLGILLSKSDILRGAGDIGPMILKFLHTLNDVIDTFLS